MMHKTDHFQNHSSCTIRDPSRMLSSDTGCSSYDSAEGKRVVGENANKLNHRRINSSRRSQSAERLEAYTYIETPSARAITSATSHNERMQNSTSNPQPPLYAIPSMISPPPTYDVAIAKSLQRDSAPYVPSILPSLGPHINGLPPSYDDYLHHELAMYSRSYTPPPPWSDLAPMSHHALRNSQASRSEQRECPSESVVISSSNKALRKHVKQQRLRAMANTRSLSETRANQRLTTKCEDGAFCMEATLIHSTLENGVAFCSLM